MNIYRNILLIDDNEDDRQLFHQMIMDIDSKVLLATAENGKLALDLLSTLSVIPDLIFLDLNMPVMGGLEFLRIIKTDWSYTAYKDIPVVALSTSIKEPEQCYALDATVCITKPNSMRLYRSILADILSRDIVKERGLLRALFGHDVS